MSCRCSFCLLFACAACALIGCRAPRVHELRPAAEEPDVDAAVVRTVAPGVTYRRIPEGDALLRGIRSDVLLLDVDLDTPGISVRVAAQNFNRDHGKLFASAYTVRDWCVRRGAVGGINGGFFGASLDDGRKQPLGLLVTEGSIRVPVRAVPSPSHHGRSIVRSVLAFTRDGAPMIAALTFDGAGLSARARSHSVRVRGIESAVGCGPRLISHGRRWVADREERLVDPRRVPRTFVGYDLESARGRRGGPKRPRRLLMAIGMEMTFAEAAQFIERYFRQVVGAECAEAMCLDGGSSSQLAYRSGDRHATDGYTEARPSVMTVPTAVLVERVSSPKFHWQRH